MMFLPTKCQVVPEALAGNAREKVIEFGLHGLGNEALRAFTEHRAREILSLRCSTKFNDPILLHGYRDSLWWVAENDLAIAFQQVTLGTAIGQVSRL
jgi:hypothetical protein